MDELKRKIEELENKIDLMEMAQNLNQNAKLNDALDFIKEIDTGSYDSSLTRTISINTTPASFSVPEDPVGTATVKINGSLYRILLYSLT